MFCFWCTLDHTVRSGGEGWRLRRSIVDRQAVFKFGATTVNEESCSRRFLTSVDDS